MHAKGLLIIAALAAVLVTALVLTGIATARGPRRRGRAINAVAAKPAAFYVNVHNSKHLAGAMRGQLTANAQG
jgi:hypothetical protein